MSLQQLKDELASLPRQAQDELIAFLFQLRHAGDADYQATIARHLDDKDRAHWLSPDEFERKLDERHGQ